MIDYNVFRQFGQAITHLGEMARKADLPDEQRVERAKEVILSKIDRQMAVDLEACVKCGYCSEACHFYVQTNEAKYVPPATSTYRRTKPSTSPPASSTLCGGCTGGRCRRCAS